MRDTYLSASDHCLREAPKPHAVSPRTKTPSQSATGPPSCADRGQRRRVPASSMHPCIDKQNSQTTESGTEKKHKQHLTQTPNSDPLTPSCSQDFVQRGRGLLPLLIPAAGTQGLSGVAAAAAVVSVASAVSAKMEANHFLMKERLQCRLMARSLHQRGLL